MKRNKLRIMFKGKQLQYKDKIKDYKLMEGVTIRLVNESNKVIKKEEVKVKKPETVPVRPKQPIQQREIEEDKIQTALQF